MNLKERKHPMIVEIQAGRYVKEFYKEVGETALTGLTIQESVLMNRAFEALIAAVVADFAVNEYLNTKAVTKLMKGMDDE